MQFPEEFGGCALTPGAIIWFQPQAVRGIFKVGALFLRRRSGPFAGRRESAHPVDAADPELNRLLQKQIDQLEAAFTEDFPEQVRRVLHAAILSRHCRADQVAASDP